MWQPLWAPMTIASCGQSGKCQCVVPFWSRLAIARLASDWQLPYWALSWLRIQCLNVQLPEWPQLAIASLGPEWPKSAVYRNGRNSKTIYPIYMIFGRHMQKTNIYETMKSFFLNFYSIFKLHHKIPWLATSWLPWQPCQNSGFMVLCELFLCITIPILKVLRKLVFELRLLPCLTNQRPSLVTMATRLKRQPFSKSTGHGLRGGISSMWAGI